MPGLERTVALEQRNGHLRFTAIDDGAGFDERDWLRNGLQGMADR
jgi:signal transduction histidine kinase